MGHFSWLTEFTGGKLLSDQEVQTLVEDFLLYQVGLQFASMQEALDDKRSEPSAS